MEDQELTPPKSAHQKARERLETDLQESFDKRKAREQEEKERHAQQLEEQELPGEDKWNEPPKIEEVEAVATEFQVVDEEEEFVFRGENEEPLDEPEFLTGTKVKGTALGKEYVGTIVGYEDGRWLRLASAVEQGIRYPIQATGWAYHVLLEEPTKQMIDSGNIRVVLPEDLLERV